MQIELRLIENKLWREFDSHKNEMIITKIGRNLFPILEFQFRNVSEHANYRIGISMEPISYHKLKYVGQRWESLDVVEELVQSNEVFVVKSGRELLQRGLKLEKLKLTNSKDAIQKSDQTIRVQSMRQYIPVIKLYEILQNGGQVLVGSFQFQETKFIAVTAYQSEAVKKLKVEKNKFAQGFREHSKPPSTSPSSSSTTCSTKRPTSTNSSNSSPDSTLSDLPDIPAAKKGRDLQYTPLQENVAPNFYQFPMHNFQGYQPNYQTNFQGFNPANFWNPHNTHYDYHSNPYSWNQWS